MIDEKDFFQHAALRIFSSLEIDRALWNCLLFTREFIPADFMVMYVIDQGLAASEIVASADVNGGKTLSMVRPVPMAARRTYEELVRDHRQVPVFIVDRAGDYADPSDSVFWYGGHLTPESSMMILRVRLEGQVLGSVAIGNNLGHKYSAAQAQTFSLLNEPFAIALSNYLRYREVLRLTDLLQDDKQYLQSELWKSTGDEIIGADFGLKPTMDMVRQIAPLASPVLILGETGTGKEMIASTIHNLSARKEGPFIKVNCGAIPETLIDSELFGHEKGSFTGALSQKRGRFERAHKGTIFLDEIGELPPDAQVRLLRVLQEKEIERVGGTDPIRVDIRIVAATHRNLETMLAEGTFRSDLYFRLNVFPILIPPLRERLTDIPALVHYFLQKGTKEMGLSRVPSLAPSAMKQLMRYAWPGNVRELENVVDRALILHNGQPLTFKDLRVSPAPAPPAIGTITEQSETVASLDDVVGRHILHVLEMTDGQIGGDKGAARIMQVNPSTLRSKMRRLRIAFGANRPAQNRF